jgi:hypothetical protein
MATQIPQQALAALDAKSRSASSPAQPAVPAPQHAAPAGAQDDSDADKGDSSSDESIAASVNLLKLYSHLNAAICDLFDSLGVKRSLTMPHQAGQSMADHITDVGGALRKVGGITANLVTATHTRHDPKGGATVAFPSDQLRQTIIPKNFEPAKTAVATCRTLVNKIAGLVPDEPAAQQAKSQIKLIGQQDMAGMHAFDAGAALVAIIHPLFQMLARNHSAVKHGGHHNPQLTAPKAE